MKVRQVLFKVNPPKLRLFLTVHKGDMRGGEKGKCRGHARRGWASKLEGNRSHSHFIFHLIFSNYKQTFVKES